MNNLRVVKPLGDHLREQSPVAMFGRWLGAEQTHRLVDAAVARYEVIDGSAFVHQASILHLVARPRDLLFLVIVENFLRRSIVDAMAIGAAAYDAQKIFQVSALRETRELCAVVKSNVEENFYSVELDRLEKLFGRLLREADRENVHQTMQ